MTDTEALAGALRAEQSRLHAKTLGILPVATASVSIILATVIWPHAQAAGDPFHSMALLAGWMGLLGVGLLFHIALHLSQRQAQRAAPENARWLRRHRLAVAVHGFLWGSLAFVMHQLPERSVHDAITFAALAIVAGWVTTGSFDRLGTALFSVPATAPALFHLWDYPGGARPLLGAALLLFAGMMVLAVLRGYRGFESSVRRRLEQQRAASQARLLEQLLQNTEQGVWFLDNKGLTTDLNRAMCRLLGRTREEVLGRSVFDFFSDEDLATLQHQLELRKKGLKEGYEIGITQPDGSRIACFNNATPIYDADGEKVGSVGMWTNLTPLKTALRQAQDSRSELFALLGAFPGCIAAANDEGHFVFVNDDMARMIGLPAQELLGRRVADMPASQHFQRSADLRRMRQGEILVDEIEIPANHGQPERFLQLTRVGGRADSKGRHTFYAFGIDITALKRTEQRLVTARDEADRANRAKSQFMSQMSHELRTPLNAILGFGQLLQSDAALPLAPAQLLKVQEILRGAEHLLNLINGLLDISRIESGQFAVQFDVVSPTELVGEALALVQPLAAQHGIVLPDAPGGPGQLFVRADRTRLLQVLLNLLSNAIKYNREGGQVHIEWQVQETALTIGVRDTGTGLTREQLSQLFEPFRRVHALAARIEGTGIGLALSRRLVEAMGGEIGVDSNAGQGSLFWIRLQRAESVPVSDNGSAAALKEVSEDAVRDADTGELQALNSQRAARARTVLYIEDNPVNLLVMQAMLARIPGLQMLAAEDGEPGLALALQARPELILTDIQMPGMGGHELLARLRAEPSLCHIPVVAISADALPDSVARGLAAGFADYLTKPVQMEALHAVVLRHLTAVGDSAATA